MALFFDVFIEFEEDEIKEDDEEAYDSIVDNECVVLEVVVVFGVDFL